ncbi:nucleotidyltransferase domain protein [Clostridium argentinense CDC 2741]|uniref:Nucleotidyltransferase domain protein n=1 Tax=Clostridium argentinense CDC 2741 TaxID=1418104 RepID=A0A0C1R3A2_9CLOT|nr:nucleotidyltransferase domain-containing protein [Clostridium argentinense]KIE44951.1 nucleotidyltransferase domain protein [Clostridium argentinense CDC 2741]
MNNSQIEILKKIKSKDLAEISKNYMIKNILVFGSVLTDDFNINSDVDIAILSDEKLKLNDILSLELFFEEILNRPIDVVDLNSTTLDLFIKINILNTGKVLYTSDNNKSLEELIDKLEWHYRENENFFYYRKRDLLS